jgi:hypothetical protein
MMTSKHFAGSVNQSPASGWKKRIVLRDGQIQVTNQLVFSGSKECRVPVRRFALHNLNIKMTDKRENNYSLIRYLSQKSSWP